MLFWARVDFAGSCSMLRYLKLHIKIPQFFVCWTRDDLNCLTLFTSNWTFRVTTLAQDNSFMESQVLKHKQYFSLRMTLAGLVVRWPTEVLWKLSNFQLDWSWLYFMATLKLFWNQQVLSNIVLAADENWKLTVLQFKPYYMPDCYSKFVVCSTTAFLVVIDKQISF